MGNDDQVTKLRVVILLSNMLYTNSPLRLLRFVADEFSVLVSTCIFSTRYTPIVDHFYYCVSRVFHGFIFS